MPWLTGKKTGNVRDYVYWYNQGNSQRNRNLQAVRWSKWRLYRSLPEDAWRLYDLSKDPKQTRNIADEHPEVVKQFQARVDQAHQQIPDTKRIGWIQPLGKKKK